VNRYVLVLAATCVLGAGPAPAATETYREQSELAVNAAGFRGLLVENPRGRVEVRPSSDGRLHLTALKIVRSHVRSHAQALARETRVETATEGGRFVVRVRYPQRQSVRLGFWDLFSGGVTLPTLEVRLALTVPEGMAVTLASASGDLWSEGLSGPQSLRSASGDITVNGARGPLEISTASGDLTVQDIARVRVQTVSGDVEIAGARGAVVIHATSGDLEVRDAADSLDLGTVSGDVRVSRAPRGVSVTTTSGDVQVGSAAGSVRIGTSSGDVSVELDQGLQRAEVTTVSGEIEARLAPALGCALEVRTANGELQVLAPLRVETMMRHVLTGRVRDGRVPVLLRSSSGNITVKSGGNGS
jgi:hypothetical protein